MSFQGEYINTIDPKGRASIPARFREALLGAYGDERVMVTKNLDNGLSVYPLSSWSGIMERVEKSPAGPTKKAVIMTMIAPAAECAFDKQGRIQIPLSLRTYAELEKEIVIVGLFEKIDIYSQLRHAAVNRQLQALLQAEPQAVADLGF
ncbi:MAG: division/cell wall cluster transcriptional repressor MraZ [Desulfuromonadales bacterium]